MKLELSSLSHNRSVFGVWCCTSQSNRWIIFEFHLDSYVMVSIFPLFQSLSSVFVWHVLCSWNATCAWSEKCWFKMTHISVLHTYVCVCVYVWREQMIKRLNGFSFQITVFFTYHNSKFIALTSKLLHFVPLFCLEFLHWNKWKNQKLFKANIR